MTVTTHVGSSPLEAMPNKWIALGKKQFESKPVRYAAVSAIAIMVSQATTAVFYGLLRFSERNAQLVSFVASTIPSYYLNRMWVWGKGGKSHFWKEIFPFWALGIVQLILSLLFIAWSQSKIKENYESHLIRTLGLMFSMLFIYGVMWIGKYVFFNKVLFKHKPEGAGSSIVQ
jgi:putative flippase GtrA